MTDSRLPVSPLAPPSPRLGLSPIERFWLAEDLPGNSLSFFHKYVLDEDVNKPRLLAAFARASIRHPLPFCEIHDDGGGKASWQASALKPAQRVRDRSPEPYESVPGINLEREPGIRLWYSNDTIWFEYHHACADGRGALQLERDFFADYADPSGSEVVSRRQAEERQASWASLRHRARTRITFAGGCLRLFTGWWYLWRGLGRAAMPFPGATPSTTDQVALETYSLCFTRDTTTAVREGVRSISMTVNDLFATLVFRAIAEGSAVARTSRAIIRLIMPIDMRPEHGDLDTCANKMSFLYMDARCRDVNGSASFARSVAKRMRFLKQYMGLIVWRTIQIGPRRLERMRRYLQGHEHMVSCCISNLGIIDGLPECVQAFEATPTLRRHDTPLAVMIYTFRGQLQLTAGYDRGRLAPSTAHAFLDHLAASVCAWMDRTGSAESQRRESGRLSPTAGRFPPADPHSPSPPTPVLPEIAT